MTHHVQGCFSYLWVCSHADFFPLPPKDEFVSQPVKEWEKGSGFDLFLPRALQMVLMCIIIVTYNNGLALGIFHCHSLWQDQWSWICQWGMEGAVLPEENYQHRMLSYNMIANVLESAWTTSDMGPQPQNYRYRHGSHYHWPLKLAQVWLQEQEWW